MHAFEKTRTDRQDEEVMDNLNIEWLKNKPNFYFRYKQQLLESMIEGSCINIDSGSHIIKNAVNIDGGLPKLPYPDKAFDTVICSDTLEYIGPHKQSIGELLRIAKKKVIITAPAYRWLYGKYDKMLGHKRRYGANDFSGFETTHLFWFLVPILFFRKLFGLKHRPLPKVIDDFFFYISKAHLNFGTTILAVKYKIPHETAEKHKISIFVPIYNEEKIISRDVKLIDYIISKIPVEYEVFIVNDASTDNTKIIAKKAEDLNRKVTLLIYEIGPTRRENLAQSFKMAHGDIVAFIDVDLITSLRFLPDLINGVISGYDIVTGSRYVPGSKIKRKNFRLFISYIYNAAVRLLFRTSLADHMCGFKAFKKDVILTLVNEMGYDKLLKRGVFWDTELLVRGCRHKYTIKEIPIWWRERNKSALYFRREVRALGYIFGFLRKIGQEKR
jgi:hypothetical protein